MHQCLSEAERRRTPGHEDLYSDHEKSVFLSHV
jgi:hypothetical protein